MSVFVIDRNKKPLMPCSKKRARHLLFSKKAVIHSYYPFTIRLKERKLEDSNIQPLEIKIDPGARFTGMAVVHNNNGDINVKHLFEIEHRGHSIHEKMVKRKNFRNRRRGKLRYRPARFNNRKRPEYWLPPSLKHRVDTTSSWVNKIAKFSPINSVIMELVKFDIQKMTNPEISGVEYQQGKLIGYEVREYLLEKFSRTCVYCDKQNTPLEIEHIVPISKGGSNRISNLTLACHSCNQKKSNKDIKDFVKDKLRLERILSQTRVSLKDASAMNATRNSLYRALMNTGLCIKTGTGSLTKYNRMRLGINKTHVMDAVCVGNIKNILYSPSSVLKIKSIGSGRRFRTNLNKYGFPKGYFMKSKIVFGFQTGDIVRFKNTIGRLVVRKSGYFDIIGKQKIQGIRHTKIRKIQTTSSFRLHYAENCV